MPRKEGVRARAARINALLAQYDALNRDLNKLLAQVKPLKDEIHELSAGEYGDLVLSFGTPRTVLNQPEARRLLADNGIGIPMVTTKPPIVVNPKVK